MRILYHEELTRKFPRQCIYFASVNINKIFFTKTKFFFKYSLLKYMSILSKKDFRKEQLTEDGYPEEKHSEQRSIPSEKRKKRYLWMYAPKEDGRGKDGPGGCR